MVQYPELEIGLYRQEADSYAVELRFRRPDDAAQSQPVRGQARFDLAALRSQLLDRDAYGQTLTGSLFADQAIRQGFETVRAATQSLDKPLRVRLFIDRSAPELHNLRWETLRDPDTGAWLLTNENVLFSRFLGSSDWRPVRLRPKGDLRALVVVANPADLSDGRYRVHGHDLAPVKVADELARARRGLGDMIGREIASDPAAPGQASISAITAALRDRYDILYLVCHGGVLTKDPPGPYLWLEKADGSADVISGAALIEQVRDLPPGERPMMVVLASCESAGVGGEPRSGDEGALAALGPRLAEAGIPAVLAMQGSVSMDTVAGFMPVFFEQLRKHGQLDQAMAAARGAVRARPDAWMPVLFMRLLGGSVWFETGFSGSQPEFAQWASLLSSISAGKCTPVLGPGLLEFVLGSARDIARRWADKENIPMVLCSHDSLAQVAQYLAAYQSPHYPNSRLKRYLEGEIKRRYANRLPNDLQFVELPDLLAAVGALQRQQNPADPFNILAQLPISIYVNANPDNLLFEALKAVGGREPVETFLIWSEHLRRVSSLPVYNPQDQYRPSLKKPMVYYMQGHVSDPGSWVLSENDHFDYLMGADDSGNLPSFVDLAFTSNALLFLGFQIDDWNFRVLFRSIMNERRRYGERRDHQSVAVQIDLTEGNQQPERIHRYLERYFGENISIYWGSAEDFLKELWRRWQRDGGGG